MKDNGNIDVVMLTVAVLIVLGSGIYIVSGVISTTNESNNIHYTKVITPVYIDVTYGTIIDSNENKYNIISNIAYPSGKDFALNKYKIDNAIRNNKSATLTIQTICTPLEGCTDVVSGVEYV